MNGLAAKDHLPNKSFIAQVRAKEQISQLTIDAKRMLRNLTTD